jgi:FkbM family methyltransferase
MFKEEMRYEYDGVLNENSTVLDLGGYHGEFSNIIFNKYKSKIQIYEPIKNHFDFICDFFKGNSSIKVFNVAVSDKTGVCYLSNKGTASSVVSIGETDGCEIVKSRDILEIISEIGNSKIDLIKINIEGGEYDLLDRVISGDKIKQFSNIQVQYHNFFPDSNDRRDSINNKLKETHFNTFCYPFIWENWRLK